MLDRQRSVGEVSRFGVLVARFEALQDQFALIGPAVEVEAGSPDRSVVRASVGQWRRSPERTGGPRRRS